ncbi:MAG: class I SAM-dependent methyltransferase [Alphaproteobacteria bacterium]
MQKPSIFSDPERAASQDKRFAKLAPIRDALHLMIDLVLDDLPADTRILCVGVGTGPELIALAKANPGWCFTAVDPAAAMLDICRQKAEEFGVASRCTFHEGYLDTLGAPEPFDAATCLLVSQFNMQPEKRREFFRQIAERLRLDGYLVSADLASDMATPAYKALFEIWVRMMRFAEIPFKGGGNLGREIAVLPQCEIEEIIASSGFETPTLFFQTILIHAWYSKKLGRLYRFDFSSGSEIRRTGAKSLAPPPTAG